MVFTHGVPHGIVQEGSPHSYGSWLLKTGLKKAVSAESGWAGSLSWSQGAKRNLGAHQDLAPVLELSVGWPSLC